MNNSEQNQEFSLDDILNEFHQEPEETPETAPEESAAAAPEAVPEAASEAASEAAPEAAPEIAPEEPVSPEQAALLEADALVSDEELSDLLRSIGEEDPQTETAASETAESRQTQRIENLSDVQNPRKEPAPKPEPLPEKPAPVVIEIDPRARLRELKKKLIAGPEKRYYELPSWAWAACRPLFS